VLAILIDGRIHQNATHVGANNGLNITHVRGNYSPGFDYRRRAYTGKDQKVADVGEEGVRPVKQTLYA